MRYVLVTILLASLSFVSFGSTGSDTTELNQKAKYFFYVQYGGLVGSMDLWHPVSFSASTVHGIKLVDKYKIGIGTGIDFYQERSVVPVFVAASIELAGKANKLFFEINYGGTFSKPATEGYGYIRSEIGQMICSMMGYTIKSNKLDVGFVAGYKFQRSTDHYKAFYSYVDRSRPDDEINSTFQMDMSRVVVAVRVGWR